MSAAHALAHQETLRLRECFEYPIALPSEGFGSRAMINAALLDKSFAHGPIIESNSFEYLKAHVAGTDTISFQVEIGAPFDSGAESGLTAKIIEQRDIVPGTLWLGQLRGRSQSVAVSRFAEQVGRNLTEQFDHV